MASANDIEIKKLDSSHIRGKLFKCLFLHPKWEYLFTYKHNIKQGFEDE